MPDKWAQYAVSGTPAQPQAAAPDPWAKYAVSGGQPTTTASNINNIPDQKPAGTLSNAWNALTQPETPGSIQRTGIAPVDNALTSIHNVGGRAISTMAAPIAHPIATLGGIFNMVAHPSPYDPSNPINQRVAEGVQDYQQSPRKAAENVLGDTIGTIEGGRMIPGAADAVAPKVGDAMQTAGENMINQTVGALKNDFKRNANPGKGYFQAKLGPSLSMHSIADKAANALDATGGQIGDAISRGAGNGVTIPTSTVAAAVNGPADAARATLNGPFGPGSAALDQRMASVTPSLYKSVPTGPFPGMSPQDVFNLKQGISKNVSWSDPTAIGIKQVGQQMTGGLSGALSDAVPELKPLNNTYQNLTRLSERATDRANGSTSLSSMARRGVETGLGYGLGHATGHPLLTLAPVLADTTPVRTSLASSLYYGGKALPGLVSGGIRTVPFGGAAVSGLYNKQPDKKANK